MSYTPKEGSVAARALAILQANPEARYTAAELAGLLDYNPGSICAVMKLAVINKLVQTVKNGGISFYMLGTAAAADASTAPPPARSDPATRRPRRRRWVQRPLFNVPSTTTATS